jgi:hypothetical protein
MDRTFATLGRYATVLKLAKEMNRITELGERFERRK